ncbi:MAG: group 1 truncated hemoglobin [Gammaproteobacteria bacterium]|nr:group 1 truncated hemoglobin [Gammaproteobacteria bacterium]MCF6259730.1 group 1 truncated hemoglobin [Gammaproteobacteria bacterium]
MSDALFDRLGGEAAVNAAVDIFYRKVLADDRISSFFEGVDMDKQASKQKAFLTMAFGGPNNYSGEDMRKGHAHLVERGLNDSHFDAVVENLGATLKELGVADDLIGEVAAVAETTRNDVLGK